MTNDNIDWKSKAFDLGNGMMEAMTARELAQQEVQDLREENDVAVKDRNSALAEARHWEKRVEELIVERCALEDAAEMLWVVLANVSGSDWTQQTPEWQQAAAHFRDKYFAIKKPQNGCAVED